MSRPPLQLSSEESFERVLELAGRDEWRVIARIVPGDRTAEILAWCDNETAEGFGADERATARRKLGCSAVELVDAQINCKGDAGGVGGGVVNCKAWIPKEG